MKILIFTSNFDVSGLNRWLIEDLVDGFISNGDYVTVLLTDIYGSSEKGEQETQHDRLKVIKLSKPRHFRGKLGKLQAHAQTAIALNFGLRKYISKDEFDIGIFTSVGIMSFFKPIRMRKSGEIKKLVFILWDFFPANHIDIGRIRRSYWTKPAKYLEFFSFKNADTIFTMTPRGSEFLRNYHPEVGSKVATQAPWSAVDNNHAPHLNNKRSQKEFNVIWGGQMIPGRGIKTLIDALLIVQSKGISMKATLVGDGPRFEEFKDYVDSSSLLGIEMPGRMNRYKYRNLLLSADVGIATTIPNVSVPTFSAKISEYCAYGVPSIVSIESSSDAGQIIESAGAGIATAAGDAHELSVALLKLYEAKVDGSWESYSSNARKFFEENLSVDVVIAKIKSV